jgi:hypothetical protein
LFFAGSKKEDVLLCNIFIEITQPFLFLEDAPKYISQHIKKNTTTKVFQYSTPISMPCPNDIIHALT